MVNINKDRSDIHVVLLMGGQSKEHDVSLATGGACTRALEQAGFKVTQLDVTVNVAEALLTLKPDAVFNALHGKWGEDGVVQGLLESLRIPYTHSGVLASALAMDKQRSKELFRAANIPLADSKVVTLEQAAKSHVMPPPYVIKPVAEGSSVGVFIVSQGKTKPPADLLDRRDVLGDMVMVERFVPGKELTCAVMGDVALGVIEILPRKGFYDYKAKYEEGGSQHELPANVSPHVYRKVQNLSLKAHHALGCRGVSRADFRYDDNVGPDGELILLEINTQPGMTGTSLVPEMAAHAGHDFVELVTWMILDASLDR